MSELRIESASPASLAAAPRFRSMLFVPGNKPTWVDKALASAPDAIILDLEDAVAAREREAARNTVRESIDRITATGTPCFVRVNGWRQRGALLADLNAVVRAGLRGVVLPKVQGPEDVAALALVLGEIEAQRGISEQLEIVPLCETAEALVDRLAIYRASPRVRRAPTGVFGSPNGDAARSVGLIQTEQSDETAYILGKSILEGRAAGLAGVMGGMCTSVRDLDEVRRVAQRSRRFGANGALAIHPTHVAVLHEVYSPGDDEIATARSMVAAFAERVKSEDPDAAIVHEGRMVDIAHLRGALDTVRSALGWGRIHDDAEAQADLEHVAAWVQLQ